MNLCFRLYDPIIGRFLSVDPLSEMMNGKPHWTYYLRGAAGEEMALYSGAKNLVA